MFAVALDGPAGAGKSSVAKAVAKELNIIYVDTGALYRAIGYYAITKNALDSAEKTVELLPEISLDIAFENGVQNVLINGENVSGYIRTPEVSMAASKVSAIPAVREFLFDTQRNLAKTHSVIMDGRDIGTVVLPDAQVKVFLTASAKVRAQRRYDELTAKGQTVDFDATLKDIIKRDHDDSTREIAPLKPAEDGVVLDTSDLSFDEVVKRLLEIIKNKGVI